MDIQLKQNFEEKLRLILVKLISSLDNDYKSMLRRHSADGLLRSGSTIKATMDLISRYNSKLYNYVLSNIETLNLTYYTSIESDVLKLANETQSKFKGDAFLKLKKSTEIAGNPKLYERMLPDVEANMSNQLAIFQNDLDAKVLELKKRIIKSPLEKILWAIELALVIISIFVAGIWFKDPQGNYEPIIVGLGLVGSLIYLGIRRVAKQ